MNLLQLSTWRSRAGIARKTTTASADRPSPKRNYLRDVAITFSPDEVPALPTVRRLVDRHLSQAMAQPTLRQAGDLLPYELLVMNLLLPTEAGIVVMSAMQHRTLMQYLRNQTYALIQTKRSPLADVAADALFGQLMAILHVVENYTSIVPDLF